MSQDSSTFLHLHSGTYVKIDSVECDEHSEIWFVRPLDPNTCSSSRFAIKIMDVHRAFDYKREVRALERLQGHQNVIRLVDKEIHGGRYYMVLEMVDTDLARHVQRHGGLGGVLDEESAKELFVQMLDALAHCHAHRICHHDLKLENFLYDPVSRVVKLIDFGFSVDTSSSSLMVSSCSSSSSSPVPHFDASQSVDSPMSEDLSSEIISGRYDWCTPLYASKQVLFQEDHHYVKTDIFSLGVCLYYMLCGRFPFCSEDDEFETLKANIFETQCIEFPKMSTELSEHAKNLLRSMLARDEDQRCNIIDVYNHPWLLSSNIEYMTF